MDQLTICLYKKISLKTNGFINNLNNWTIENSTLIWDYINLTIITCLIVSNQNCL